MPPNNRQSQLDQFRVNSRYDPDEYLRRLNDALWNKAGNERDIYVARWSKTEVPGYRRLVITGQRQFTGKRALTLDVRLGPETASGEPAAFIRSRAPVSSASEYVIGSKVVPGQEQNEPYKLVGSAESLADIVRATFQSTRESRQNDLYKRDPLPIDELFAIFTNRNTPRYEKIREKYGVPTGYQLSWGVATPGEQQQLAAYMPVIMASKRSEEEISKIYSEIATREGGLGEARKLGWFMAEREEAGTFGLKRIARTINLGEEGTYAQLYRGGAREGHRPEDLVESILKHIKSSTTWFASRSPQAFPLEYYGKGEKRMMRPQTATSYEDRPDVTREGTYGASQFGEMLLSGDYSRYVQLDLALQGEERGQRAALTMGLIASVPVQSGGALMDPRELKGTAGYGFYTGQAVDLPWNLASEIDPLARKRGGLSPISEVLGMAKGLRGRIIPAGRQQYTIGNLQVEGRDKGVPIQLEGKEYTRQIEGMTMVIPPYMGKESGRFYTAEEQQYGVSEKLISTQKVQERLMKELTPLGISVEATGTTDIPYMYVNSIGMISKSSKGLFSTKAGETPVGGPQGLSVTMKGGSMAGQQLRFGMVTGEAKQPLEAFAGAFAVQPHVNKVKMLEMIDPRLAEWYDQGVQYRKDMAGFYEEYGGIQTSLEDLGVKYAELKGDQSKSHYLFLMSDLYEKFTGATEKQNEENMKRYGIFYLQGGGEVRAGIFHESAIKALQDSVDRLNKETGEKKTLEDYGIRTVPTQEKGYYDFYFAAPEGRNLALPLLTGLSIEWPGQGRNINKDITLSILQQFPQFAKEKGIHPSTLDQTGMSKERRSWLGIMGAYAFNQSASEGTVWRPNDDSNYLTIDKEMAIQLRKELDLSNQDLSEQEKMAMVNEKFGWKGLHFAKTGRFLPSPEAVEGIDEYQIIRNLGESRAHYVTQFLGSLQELLSAEATGGNISLEGHTSFMGGPDSRIGRILSGDPDIVKKVYGSEVTGAGSGKYGVLNFLKEGEMYMSKKEVYRIAETMGLKKGSDKAQLWAKIQEGDTKGLFYRYPSLSKQLATLPVKLVSEQEIMKRAGFSVEELSALSPGLVWIDPHTQEPFIGDVDRDPAGWLLGMDVLRDKDGKIVRDEDDNVTFINQAAKDPNLVKFFADNRSFKWYRSALEKLVGVQHADKYSQWMAPFAEYAETMTSDKLAGPLKAASDFGLAKMQDMAMASRIYQAILARRGTTHISTNLFRQTASVLGVPDDIRTEAVKGIAALYQSSLETSRTAGTFTPMELLVNTVMFGPAEGNLQSPEMWMSAAASRKWNDTAGKYDLGWEPFYQAGSSNQKQLMSNLILQLSKMNEFEPETLAMAFASRKGDYKANYNLIKTLLQNTPRKQWGSALLGGAAEGDLLTDGRIDETSVAGTMFMTLAALRTHKLSGMDDDRGMVLRGMMHTKIPYGDKLMSLNDFLQTEEVKTLSAVFKAATGKEYDRPGAGILTMSQFEQIEGQLPSTARTGSGFTDILLGLGKFFGVGRSTKEITAPGGLPDDTLIDQLRLGPNWLRASELSSIAIGIPEVSENLGLHPLRKTSGNYGPAAVLKAASKWFGNLFDENVMKNIDAYTKLSGSAQATVNKGNKYELAMIAYGTENLDSTPGGYLKLRSGYKVTTEGLTMVPHEMGTDTPSLEAQVTINQAGQNVTKRVTGSADMIGLMTDPESGEEYLHVQELKFGGGRSRQAGVQAVVYRDLLKRMAEQDEEGLRTTLGKWREGAMTVYNEARRGLGPLEGVLPGMAEEDWVERAITAIKGGRIRLSTASGLGNEGFLHSIERPVYKVSGVDPEIEKLSIEDIVSAVSKHITGSLADDIYKKLYDLWTTGSVSIPYGSDLRLGETTKPLATMENMLNWFTERRQDLQNVLGMRSFRMGGFMSGFYRSPNTGAGGGDEEQNPVQRAIRPNLEALPGLQALRNNPQGSVLGETLEPSERQEGIQSEVRVNPGEEMANIGSGVVISSGDLYESINKLTDTIQTVLGGGGEGGDQGGGRGGGYYGAMSEGDLSVPPNVRFQPDIMSQMIQGTVAYQTVSESDVLDRMARGAKLVQQRMQRMKITPTANIDLRKQRTALAAPAENIFFQALLSGKTELRDYAIQTMGQATAEANQALAPARKAVAALRGPGNRERYMQMLESVLPPDQFQEVSRQVEEMEGAMVGEDILGGGYEGRAMWLNEMLPSFLGKQAKGGTRGTTASVSGTQVQFSPQQQIDILNNAVANVQKFSEAVGEATPGLFKLSKQFEESQATLSELERVRGREGAWEFEATKGGEMIARRYATVGGRRAVDMRLQGPQAEAAFADIERMTQLREDVGAMGARLEPPEQRRGGRALRWGSLARGIFGGFGWMFLQRALGMGLRGVTEGFEESQQFAAQEQQMGMRYFGGGQVQLGAGGPFYARQRAMIAQGQTGLGALAYQTQTNLTGTAAGDWWRAAQTGLGVGMAGTFLASELGQAGFIAPEALGGAYATAGIAGLAVGAIAMPAIMQYSYLQNQEGTMARVAAQRMRQQNPELSGWQRWWSGVSANWAGWSSIATQNMTGQWATQPSPANVIGAPGSSLLGGPTFQEFADRIRNAGGFASIDWLGVTGTPGASLGETEFEAQRKRMTQMGQQYQAGGITVGRNRQETAANLIRMFMEPGATPEQFANMPTEVWTNALMLQMAAAPAGEQVNLQGATRLANLQMAGLAPEQMYTAAINAGMMPSIPNMASVFGQISTQPEVARIQQMGLQAMGTVSPAGRLAMGIQPTPESMMNQSYRMGIAVQTPGWDIAARAAEASGYWETRGYRDVGSRAVTPWQLSTAGQQGLFNVEQGTIWDERQRARREGYMAQGWNPQQVNAVLRMYEEARRNPQAMAWMPQVEQFMQQGVAYGVAPEAMMGAGTSLAQMAEAGQYGQINMATNAMAGNPQAIAMMNLQQMGQRPTSVTPGQWALQASLGPGGMRLPVDITAGGRITGMNMFSSYISPADANLMFAPGWQNRPVGAATTGLQAGGFNYIGQWAIRAQQAQLGYQQQMAQVGAAQQGVALTREYYLGGPRFGRGLFAVQDDQRALGYEQTEWQFGRQRAQLAMQGQQFRENQALQWQGMQMQRQFARADWSFQDQTRALQWGWRQEDFQENVRFMTGRQRRLAERQMGRETIMHGLEGEQIQRQRDQQKQLWGLEDERFRLAKEHYTEQERFQKEGIKKQEEFYQRRRKLEEEMVEMQRTYMLEQLKLQEQQIGAQAEYAQLMHEHQMDMIAMEQTVATTVDDWKTSWEYGNLAAEVFQDVYDWIVKIGEQAGSNAEVKQEDTYPKGIDRDQTTEEPTTEEPRSSPTPKRRQHGGYIEPNLAYLVGENGPEMFIPPQSPWNNAYIPTVGSSMTAGGMQQITIYIGNEKLGTYVLDTVSKELRVG